MASAMPAPDPAEIEQELRSAQLHEVEFHLDDTRCRLIRLNTDDYTRLAQSSFPIEEDLEFYWSTLRAYRNGVLTMNLAQAFVTLELLFGRSSHFYDDFKCSFSFPLFVHLQKSSGAYPYLLKIQDYKGAIDFNFRRIIDAKTLRTERNVYHQPLDDEFSRKEIAHFSSFLYGFVQGYFESAGKTAAVRPFFRKIGACLCVYGYRDGEYFEKSYGTQEEYLAAVTELAESDTPQQAWG